MSLLMHCTREAELDSKITLSKLFWITVFIEQTSILASALKAKEVELTHITLINRQGILGVADTNTQT